MEKLSSATKKLSLLALTLFFLLEGCAPVTPPNYRATAFCADLCYVTQSTRLCATVRVEAPRDSSDGLPRNAILSFTSPEALRGLVVTRKDGEIFYEYEGLSSSTDATGLLRCVDLLLTEYPNNTEDQSYEIRLAPSTGYPEEIVTSKETLQIQNFQKISSDG